MAESPLPSTTPKITPDLDLRRWMFRPHLHIKCGRVVLMLGSLMHLKCFKPRIVNLSHVVGDSLGSLDVGVHWHFQTISHLRSTRATIESGNRSIVNCMFQSRSQNLLSISQTPPEKGKNWYLPYPGLIFAPNTQCNSFPYTKTSCLPEIWRPSNSINKLSGFHGWCMVFGIGASMDWFIKLQSGGLGMPFVLIYHYHCFASQYNSVTPVLRMWPLCL